MTDDVPAVPAHVDADIVLYRLQACPYCERVVRTLEDLDLAYHSRFIEPMHGDRNIIKRLSGKREVPVIVDSNTGVTMAESADIIKYLHKTYRNRGGD